jgi:hypothetical protein
MGLNEATSAGRPTGSLRRQLRCDAAVHTHVDWCCRCVSRRAIATARKSCCIRYAMQVPRSQWVRGPVCKYVQGERCTTIAGPAVL